MTEQKPHFPCLKCKQWDIGTATMFTIIIPSCYANHIDLFPEIRQCFYMCQRCLTSWVYDVTGSSEFAPLDFHRILDAIHSNGTGIMPFVAPDEVLLKEDTPEEKEQKKELEQLKTKVLENNTKKKRRIIRKDE